MKTDPFQRDEILLQFNSARIFLAEEEEEEEEEARIVVTLRDVTEHRRAEGLLHRSEERFRIAAEYASDLIYEWDILSGRLEWYGNVDKALGYAPGEFPRTLEAWKNIIHPEDSERVINAVENHLQTREPFFEEYRVLRKDATILYWTDVGTALWDENGKPYKWIGANTDITGRKRAEAEKEKQRRIELAVTTAAAWFLNLDFDQAMDAVLEDISRLSGAGRAYLFLLREGGAIMDNTHEWCAEGVSPQKENLQNLPSDMFPWWMEKLGKHETIHITDVSAMPPEAAAEKEILESQDIKSLLALPMYRGQELAGFMGFDNVVNTGDWKEADLTLLTISAEMAGAAYGRHRAEQALRLEREDLNTILENNPGGTVLLDRDGRYLYVNPEFTRITGYGIDDVPTGREWFRKAFPDQASRRRAIALWKEDAQRGGQWMSREFEIACRDGSIRSINFNVTLLDDGRSVLNLTDITERKRAEGKINKQLSELQRWQSTMLDREDRVLELKREVNGLLTKLGQATKYFPE